MPIQIEPRVSMNLWVARIIPLLLAGIVGYATYVVVALLCGKAVLGCLGLWLTSECSELPSKPTS